MTITTPSSSLLSSCSQRCNYRHHHHHHHKHQHASSLIPCVRTTQHSVVVLVLFLVASTTVCYRMLFWSPVSLLTQDQIYVHVPSASDTPCGDDFDNITTTTSRISRSGSSRNHHNHNGTSTTETTTTKSTTMIIMSNDDQFNQNHDEQRQWRWQRLHNAMVKFVDRNTKVCAGKERLLEVLLRVSTTSSSSSLAKTKAETKAEAMIRNHFDTSKLCSRLPYWEEVISLYGENPIVMVQPPQQPTDTPEPSSSSSSSSSRVIVRVTGLCNNSGAPFLKEILALNLRSIMIIPTTATTTFDEPQPDAVVPGPPLLRNEREVFAAAASDTNGTTILLPTIEIVVIRDPFRWMHRLDPNEEERSSIDPPVFAHNMTTPFKVQVNQSLKEQEHYKYDLLANEWSSYYRRHDLTRDHYTPRIMIIRYEDLLFHTEAVVRTIAHCMGLPDVETFPFQYPTHWSSLSSSIRSNSSSRTDQDGSPLASVLEAFAFNGHETGRYDGMTDLNREFVNRALDSTLMQTFHYRPAPPYVFPENDHQNQTLHDNNNNNNNNGSLSSSVRDDVSSIHRLVSRHVTCQGKEKLLGILLRAGQETVGVEDCNMLPTWTEISSLYGDEPIVLGLETCQRFRDNLAVLNRTDTMIHPFVRVAGLFNTGTNALSQSFSLNIEQIDNPLEYQVPGGKHVPSKPIWISTIENITDRAKVLPVVLVRDPMRWMQSMCKVGYNARWKKGLDGRCPNLVPTDRERTHPEYQNISTFNITVSLKNERWFDHYPSLADMWSEWNRIYYDFETPRLIIRFEDALFHGEQVMHLITECAGIQMKKPYQIQVDRAKRDKKSADFVTAMAKYGRRYGRIDGLYPKDLEYLNHALDAELMRAFYYPDIHNRHHIRYEKIA